MIESQTPGFISLLSSLSPDAHIRGKQFERVAKWWLTQDPLTSLDIKQAWLWDEWPERSGPDIGIDIVAEMFDGTLCAIQAKCFDENRDIPKSELDSFVSAASPRIFQHRWLIATTDKLSANARRMLDDQHVTRILRSDLEQSLENWPASIDELNPIPQPRYSPRPHQDLAITDVVRGLNSNSRGQLIMACGTGKTLTALWIKETLTPKTTMVLVPSLNLLAQTLSEWAQNTSSPWNYLCVCSDDTVNKSDDQPISTVGDLRFDVTTDAEKISAFLSLDGEKIIFSTYQSSAQVAKAQEQSGVSFDLVICDEAHRLTGKTDADYATVLNEKKIVGHKRLFMTATPRTYTTAAKTKAEDRGVEITSMDDEQVYGPVLHKLSFGEAIKQDLLSDYRVLIVGVTDPQVQDLIDRRELVSVNDAVNTDARTLAAHIGLAKATKDYNLKRTISFHSRIKSADQFAKDHLKILDWLPDTHKPSGNTWTGTISGAMNTGDRRRLIKQLSLDGEDRHALLTNARCLTEGVDVPSLDGVAFIDPRSSQVDIIQAVGRAIRKSKDKESGTIILPVLIPTDADAEHALRDTAFKPIWAILNALKSHDEEFAIELSNLRIELGKRGIIEALPDRLIEDLPADIDSLLPGFAFRLSVAIIEQTTSNWDWWFGLLTTYISQYGNSLVPWDYKSGDHKLGQWVTSQRGIFNSQKMFPDRIKKLESLNGWTWSALDAIWEQNFLQLKSFAQNHGHSHPSQRTQLGAWCNTQRQSYKISHEFLTQSRINKLESIQGWAWFPHDANWEQMFEALRSFVETNGHCIPTKKLGAAKLSSWCEIQRNLYRNKGSSLNESRIERLESIPGWKWNPIEEAWENLFGELQKYFETYGNTTPPRNGEWKYLYNWIQSQRQNYRTRRSFLGAERIQRLESFPDWVWNTNDTAWEDMFQELVEFERLHGHCRPTQKGSSAALGSWVSTQRLRYKGKGKGNPLTSENITRLESIPGWMWVSNTRAPLMPRKDAAVWLETFRQLEIFIQENGISSVSRDLEINGRSIGLWITRQRYAKKTGKLSLERTELLEQLPGWTWSAR